jgi:peptidoglycan/xylan/chitin deacetylase (PgdA/CDA1 family)
LQVCSWPALASCKLTLEQVKSTLKAPKGAKIYLTLDDSPYNANGDEETLKSLKYHNILASYFISGFRVKGHEDVLMKIVEAGHFMGDHCFTHWAQPGDGMTNVYNHQLSSQLLFLFT